MIGEKKPMRPQKEEDESKLLHAEKKKPKPNRTGTQLPEHQCLTGQEGTQVSYVVPSSVSQLSHRYELCHAAGTTRHLKWHKQLVQARG